MSAAPVDATAPPSGEAVQRELAELQRKLAACARTLPRAANVSVGCSDKDEIYQEDKLRLYHYRPLAPATVSTPLLIVYALVNRPYVLDLQPDRSLIRRLLGLGIDVYLIDWGYPDAADRYLDLDDYINRYIDNCVDLVLRRHLQPALNLLGVCQGGTFSLCYTALQPAKVRNLITMVTPVDFHTPDNLLARWVRGLDIDALVEAWGVVPGDLLNASYVSLMPFRLLQQKYVNLLEVGDDQASVDNFMRMEKWIFDSPDLAGEAFRQFARWFFQENRLVRGGLQIGGRDVDLRQITQPMLNIYGRQDHLVPPSASRPLAGLVASRDYQALDPSVGHIGMYVSARAQQQLPEAIAYWLGRR